ncbi:MAG: hypothetical protein ACLQVG_26185 [Terriglobia bacterium]
MRQLVPAFPRPRACSWDFQRDTISTSAREISVEPPPARWLTKKRQQAAALVRLKAHLVEGVEVLFEST